MVKTRNPFLKLNIYRDKLNDAIEDFFMSNGIQGTFNKELEEKDGGRYRFHYKIEESRGFLDFRFNKDGTTSIDLSAGGKTEFKENLAISIRDSAICTEPEVVGLDKSHFVFDQISVEEFEDLLTMILEDQKIENPNPTEIEIGKRWVLAGNFGEVLTVTYYYKSEKVVLQGRPLKLFMEFYTYLMTLFDPEQIPKIFESNKVVVERHVKKDDIREELKLYLPLSNDSIDEKLKKVLYQALYNLKIRDDMFEYTQLAFPALKALEGHLKHIMYQQEIPLNSGRFEMFKKGDNGKYQLHKQVDINKFTSTQLRAINDAYHYYYVNRHSLFHWDEVSDEIPVMVDTTRIIERPEESFGIIKNVFKIIDSYYT